MPEVLLPDEVAHEVGVLPGILVVSLHHDIEVRFDLEELLEVGVHPVEELVEHRRPDEGHLDIEGDGLGFDGLCRYKSHPLPRLLDDGLSGLQGSLEPIPGEGVSQEVFDTEDQVTAVGFMERTRPDHREIGREYAELDLFLDLSEQVLKRRVLLDDDRRPFGLSVVHDRVHVVLPERELADEGLELRRNFRLFGNPEEVLEVLEYVILDGVDVLRDLRDVSVVLLEFSDEVSYSVEGDIVVQVLDRLGPLALDILHLPERAPELGVERIPPLQDLGPHRLGKTDELLLGDRPPVDDRDRQEADGAHLDDEALFLGTLVNFGEEFRPPLLEGLEFLFTPPRVLFALKRTGQRLAGLLDELLHILPEPHPPPGREGDGVGLILVLEVVDVYPVACPGFCL